VDRNVEGLAGWFLDMKYQACFFCIHSSSYALLDPVVNWYK